MAPRVPLKASSVIATATPASRDNLAIATKIRGSKMLIQISPNREEARNTLAVAHQRRQVNEAGAKSEGDF